MQIAIHPIHFDISIARKVYLCLDIHVGNSFSWAFWF